MPTLRFNPGVTFDTDAPLRIERRFDGYYVVGNGMLVPVGDRLDAGNGPWRMRATGGAWSETACWCRWEIRLDAGNGPWRMRAAGGA
jgi:hypothetical protein